MSFKKLVLNKPFISPLTSDDYRYVRVYLRQEQVVFEHDMIVLLIFWAIIPCARFFQNIPFAQRVYDYGFAMLLILPVIFLAGWLLYQNRIVMVKRELKKDAKTTIRTSIESIVVDKYNSIVLHTTYSKHRVFKLGNVIGTIKLNKPITISYLEGCDRVIDYDQ